MNTANVTLQTLMAVLVANGQEELILLALKVDNNLNILPFQMGEEIIIEVNKKIAEMALDENMEFESSSYSNVYIKCPIVTINHLSTDKTYMCQLPDGSYKWVGRSIERNENRLTPVKIKRVAEVLAVEMPIRERVS